MPAPPADRSAALDAVTAESAESMAAMEAEAAEFFAARASQQASESLNPVAEAVEKAVAAPAKPSAPAKPAAKPEPPAAKPTGKVAGPPALKKAEAAPEKTAAPAKEGTKTEPAADPNAPDFSDVPREYTPGKTRAAQWDKLNAKADHYEALSTKRAQEVADLQAALEAAKASTTPSTDVQARLTALQSERDALQARLEAVAVERSPRFEAQFKPRQQAAIAQAKQAVGPENAAKIESLLSMGESSYRDNAVEELLASLPPLRATKLTQAVADLDRLSAERASLASQSGELYKQWLSEEQSQRERQNAERIAKATTTFDTEVKAWESAGITPDEVAAARSVYTGKDATLQDASRAALWGAIGPRVAGALQEANARVVELEGELAKLRAAQPGVGAAASGALPSGSGDDEDDPGITGYAERIARQAARAGIRFGS